MSIPVDEAPTARLHIIITLQPGYKLVSVLLNGGESLFPGGVPAPVDTLITFDYPRAGPGISSDIDVRAVFARNLGNQT